VGPTISMWPFFLRSLRFRGSKVSRMQVSITWCILPAHATPQASVTNYLDVPGLHSGVHRGASPTIRSARRFLVIVIGTAPTTSGAPPCRGARTILCPEQNRPVLLGWWERTGSGPRPRHSRDRRARLADECYPPHRVGTAFQSDKLLSCPGCARTRYVGEGAGVLRSSIFPTGTGFSGF
jgi:hypothetical protein